jgi:adenylate kinase family enzyme
MPQFHLSGLPVWWSALQPQRILIVGPSGSGKTTLARQLGQIHDFPFVDLDDLHWLPNWQTRPHTELRAAVAAVVAQEAWVISGNYNMLQDLTWPRAQLVIWLDLSLPLTLGRVIWRCLTRSILKEPCCNGNYESLRMTFLSKDSLLLWVLHSHAKIRLRYCERAEAETGSPVLRLNEPAAVETFFRQLKRLRDSRGIWVFKVTR